MCSLLRGRQSMRHIRINMYSVIGMSMSLPLAVNVAILEWYFFFFFCRVNTALLGIRADYTVVVIDTQS